MIPATNHILFLLMGTGKQSSLSTTDIRHVWMIKAKRPQSPGNPVAHLGKALAVGGVLHPYDPSSRGWRQEELEF